MGLMMGLVVVVVMVMGGMRGVHGQRGDSCDPITMQAQVSRREREGEHIPTVHAPRPNMLGLMRSVCWARRWR